MACIYCNKVDDLNKSHIIPDSMTNSNIMFKNSVCKIEHNSDFGNTFEKSVLDNLGTMLNYLSIKSSKSEKYPEMKIRFKIDDIEFCCFVDEINKLENGTGIFETQVNGNKLIYGPKKIVEMKNGYEKKFYSEDYIIDVVTYVQDINIFFSINMYRLISKIAYEWFCFENRIEEKIEDFSDIIEFIINGGENKFVKIIYEPNVFKQFLEKGNLSSHYLFINIIDSEIQVIVSFFGVALYVVTLGSFDINKLKNRCFFRECSIYGFFRRFRCENIDILNSEFQFATFNVLTKEAEFFDESDEKRYTSSNVFLFNYITGINSGLEKQMLIESDNKLNELIRAKDIHLKDALNSYSNNINILFNTKLLTLRNLKRCIKKYKLNEFYETTREISINDIHFLYFMYVVFDDINNVKNIIELNMYLVEKKGILTYSEDIMEKFLNVVNNDDKLGEKIHVVSKVINQWS